MWLDCGLGYAYKSDYERHLFHETRNEPFDSKKCNTIVSTKFNLKRHEDECSSLRKPQECERRGKHLLSQRQLHCNMQVIDFLMVLFHCFQK